MRRIRFPTIADVFDAYSDLDTVLRVKPSEDEPIAYLERALREGRADEAFDFCAFLLPRREAVWWACRCLFERDGGPARDERTSWETAAAWVRTADDRRRRAAFDLCSGGDPSRAVTWLLWAVVWSGGPMDPTMAHPVAAPPDLCGKALRNALTITRDTLDREGDRAAFVRLCVRLALEVAGGDDDVGAEAGAYLRARAEGGAPA
ncbi:MAG: hypothetical protein OEL76_04240 [Siculibacillus sp.]|nr:hypothetical protein [Siculibacillus sp.]